LPYLAIAYTVKNLLGMKNYDRFYGILVSKRGKLEPNIKAKSSETE
jgi:hypothetical protein